MRVLLVEDDTFLAGELECFLRQQGWLPDVVNDGEQADLLLGSESYDAIVLDLGLPGGSGLSWLEHWRRHGSTLPVLILTARDRWADKAAGFSAGADDYLTKPFEPAELLFRLRALVRRSHGLAHPVIRVGDLALDTHTGVVTLAGVTVAMTGQELRLLTYLMHAAPRMVSRSELAEHVYDRDQAPDSNVIDVQISRLRRKIGADRIETLRGQGYRIAGPA